MDFNLLADAEARSPALSLSDSGTPQHEHSCKGQDHSGECKAAGAGEAPAHPWGRVRLAGAGCGAPGDTLSILAHASRHRAMAAWPSQQAGRGTGVCSGMTAIGRVTAPSR